VQLPRYDVMVSCEIVARHYVGPFTNGADDYGKLMTSIKMKNSDDDYFPP